MGFGPPATHSPAVWVPVPAPIETLRAVLKVQPAVHDAPLYSKVEVVVGGADKHIAAV